MSCFNFLEANIPDKPLLYLDAFRFMLLGGDNEELFFLYGAVISLYNLVLYSLVLNFTSSFKSS